MKTLRNLSLLILFINDFMADMFAESSADTQLFLTLLIPQPSRERIDYRTRKEDDDDDDDDDDDKLNALIKRLWAEKILQRDKPVIDSEPWKDKIFWSDEELALAKKYKPAPCDCFYKICDTEDGKMVTDEKKEDDQKTRVTDEEAGNDGQSVNSKNRNLFDGIIPMLHSRDFIVGRKIFLTCPEGQVVNKLTGRCTYDV